MIAIFAKYGRLRVIQKIVCLQNNFFVKSVANGLFIAMECSLSVGVSAKLWCLLEFVRNDDESRALCQRPSGMLKMGGSVLETERSI